MSDSTYCKLCQVPLSGVEPALEHYAGRPHQRKEEEQQRLRKESTDSNSATASNKITQPYSQQGVLSSSSNPGAEEEFRESTVSHSGHSDPAAAARVNVKSFLGSSVPGVSERLFPTRSEPGPGGDPNLTMTTTMTMTMSFTCPSIQMEGQNQEFTFEGGRGYCNVCNIELTSPQHADQHLAGSKHQKAKARWELPRRVSDTVHVAAPPSELPQQLVIASPVSVRIPMPTPVAPPVPAEPSQWHSCEVCSKYMNTEEQLQIHKGSAKHLKAVEKQKSMQELAAAWGLNSVCDKNLLFQCQVCQKRVNSADQLRSHCLSHPGVIPSVTAKGNPSAATADAQTTEPRLEPALKQSTETPLIKKEKDPEQSWEQQLEGMTKSVNFRDSPPDTDEFMDQYNMLCLCSSDDEESPITDSEVQNWRSTPGGEPTHPSILGNAIGQNECTFEGGRGLCNICNIELTSPQHADQHLAGNKHKKAKTRWEFSRKCADATVDDVGIASLPQIASPAPVKVPMLTPTASPVPFQWHCEVCSKYMNTEEQLQIHRGSPKHQKAVEKQKAMQELAAQVVPSRSCNLLDQECSDDVTLPGTAKEDSTMAKKASGQQLPGIALIPGGDLPLTGTTAVAAAVPPIPMGQWYLCDVCKKYMNTEAELKKHRLTPKHLKAEDKQKAIRQLGAQCINSAAGDNTLWFQCHVCGKKVNSANQLKIHYGRHEIAPDEEDEGEQAEENQFPGFKYHCQICNVPFNAMASQQAHIEGKAHLAKVIKAKNVPEHLLPEVLKKAAWRSEDFSTEVEMKPENQPTEQFVSSYQTEFKQDRCLGHGGYGFVFAARKRLDDCDYAIKRIALKNSERAEEKGLREVRALAKLNHINIVRYFNAWIEKPPMGWQEDKDILDGLSSGIPTVGGSDEMTTQTLATDEVSDGIVFESGVQSRSENQSDDASISFESLRRNHGTEEGIAPPKQKLYLYIQMELCRPKTLEDWLDDMANDRCRTTQVEILQQIVKAVEFVHSKGDLMHRDLKPSNVFFSEDGIVKIGDFGLATALKNEMHLQGGDTELQCRHTAKVGTELYMSPELKAGKEYTNKVDIYAVGVISFEMFYPIRFRERVEALINIQSKLAFPDDFIRDQPTEHAFVKKLVSHNPGERPDAADILKDPLLPT